MPYPKGHGVKTGVLLTEKGRETMSSILDGIKTLDEAKDCMGKQIRKNGDISVLIVGKRVFICPDQAGLKARCGMTFSEQLETGGHKKCEKCWESALATHYAPPEPRWVEPEWTPTLCPSCVWEWLREFARLNGGPGLYTIVYDCDGHFRVEGYPHFIVEVGALTFKTREAAQYIIDHKPELLRAMQGVRG
jgi:hypothetical protein